MSIRFDKISSTAFAEMQKDAGMICKGINLQELGTKEITDDQIVLTTTGGINPTCVPTTEDWGEDVDNCPNGTKEMMHITGWECGLSCTALNMTLQSLKLALGAADIDESSGKVTPRSDIDPDKDFEDLWWIGPMTNGGWLAIELKNVFSTGGLSIQTTKKAKGQMALTLRCFYSIEDTETVPMNFYIGTVSA